MQARKEKLLRSSTLLERGPEGTSSMDGALARRRETRSARDTVLNILQDIKPRQRHANRPWIEPSHPLHPVSCQAASAELSRHSRIPREFNASSIIGDSSSRRLFHRFPPLFCSSNCFSLSLSLQFSSKRLFNCCSFLFLTDLQLYPNSILNEFNFFIINCQE